MTFRSRSSTRLRSAPITVRSRTLAALVAVALSLTGLSACRTNVGVAASAGGHVISTTEVSKYVLPGGPDAATAAQAKQSGSDLAPKSQIVQVLVQEQAFERALKAKGGVPGEAQLAALHDRAVAQLLQTSLTGSTFDRALASGLMKNGVRASFRPRFVRMLELESTLIERVRATSLPQLAAFVARTAGRVTVNPRYGAWEPSTLSLSSNTAAGLPDFLKLQGATAAAGRARPTR